MQKPSDTGLRGGCGGAVSEDAAKREEMRSGIARRRRMGAAQVSAGGRCSVPSSKGQADHEVIGELA